jgi:hypothetical protein
MRTLNNRMTVPGWWSRDHRPSTLSAEPPVASAQPLWRIAKDGHVAEAHVRPIEGVGVECGITGTTSCA